MATQEEKEQILAVGPLAAEHAKVAEKNGWTGKAEALAAVAKAVHKLQNDEDKERSNYLVPKADFIKSQGRGKNQGL